MTTRLIIFYFLASSVFSVLIYRLVKEKPLSGKTVPGLFLLLYVTLFTESFFTTAPPAWFWNVTFFFFLAGALGFPGEILVEYLREKGSLGNILKQLKKEKGCLYEIVMGTHLLSQARMGALIAIERNEPLMDWASKGVPVDALLTREILYSIFTPPGALHDGAAIIRKDRLMAGGVIFPLTKIADFPKDLGTRHRAAVGFSEVTDALCVVVSEETGTISFADRGILYYDIPFEKLPLLLDQALRFRIKNRKAKAPVQTYELAKN